MSSSATCETRFAAIRPPVSARFSTTRKVLRGLPSRAAMNLAIAPDDAPATKGVIKRTGRLFQAACARPTHERIAAPPLVPSSRPRTPAFPHGGGRLCRLRAPVHGVPPWGACDMTRLPRTGSTTPRIAHARLYCTRYRKPQGARPRPEALSVANAPDRINRSPGRTDTRNSARAAPPPPMPTRCVRATAPLPVVPALRSRGR